MIGWQNGDLFRPVSFMIYCKTSSSAQWTQSVWKYSQNPTISLPFYRWPAFMPSWPWPWPCPGARGEGSADCLGDALCQDWLHHLFVQVTFCLVWSYSIFLCIFMALHWPRRTDIGHLCLLALPITYMNMIMLIMSLSFWLSRLSSLTSHVDYYPDYPPQFCRRGGEREAKSQWMSPLPLSHEHQQARPPWNLIFSFWDLSPTNEKAPLTFIILWWASTGKAAVNLIFSDPSSFWDPSPT